MSVSNAVQENGSPSSLGQRHILIVDDERQILESLSDLLEDSFQVHTTTSGQEALQILGDFPIAVLVTDQRMPGLEGDEILARAAESSLATRVLLTGYADLESISRAVNRGHIYAYIAKPWEPSEIMMTLDRAAEHHDLVRSFQRERLLLDELMENIPDAIFFKDWEHRYTRVNQAKANLLGYREPAEIEGYGDWDFFPPDEALRIKEEDRQVTETKSPVVDKVELYSTPQGARWFSTTKVPSHIGLVGVSRDITARRKAEQQMDTLTRKLITAEVDKKTFCRDVVLAVTQGKFHLVDREELRELPSPTKPELLVKPEDVSSMRRAVATFAKDAGLSGERLDDLLLVVGEASTNAVKHATQGSWQAGVDDQGVWIAVMDNGGGIHTSDLPRALFRKGYSSKISLGLGFTLMLSLADEMWLATGPEGTAILVYKAFQESGSEDDLESLVERFA